MTDFKPPELNSLEFHALGLAVQIALCQITGVDYELEESTAVFRENQKNLLNALTSAHGKIGRSLGMQTEYRLGMQYDGTGNIQTALTKLDAGPDGNQKVTREDESNGRRRW